MWKRGLFIILSLLVLTACELNIPETGDQNTDAEAAQSFLPTIQGYTTHSTTTVQDAIVSALGGASLLTANPVQAALVAKIDGMVDCYRDVGAFEARAYVENLSNLDAARLPIAGVLAVVNQNRVRENFLACAAQTPLDGLFGAQSAEPEPCYGSGTFNFAGDTISYIYAATDTPLCDIFAQYFAQYSNQ